MFNWLRRDRPLEEIADKEPKGWTAIVVDMQQHFIDDLIPNEREELIEAHLSLLGALRKLYVPIIALELNPQTYGSIIDAIYGSVAKSYRFDLIEKCRNDGFSNMKLHARLRQWETEDIIITGVSAAYCVKATAESAIEKGYFVHTARDLLASQSYRQTEFRESLDWFRENCSYHGDHRQLLGSVKAAYKMRESSAPQEMPQVHIT